VTFFLLLFVRAYRAALAPFFGPTCRFVPSCSHYAEAALEAHGWWRGGALALRRIGKCRPFTTGGFDPVPPAPAAAQARS
jgi:hypothetical protein